MTSISRIYLIYCLAGAITALVMFSAFSSSLFWFVALVIHLLGLIHLRFVFTANSEAASNTRFIFSALMFTALLILLGNFIVRGQRDSMALGTALFGVAMWFLHQYITRKYGNNSSK